MAENMKKEKKEEILLNKDDAVDVKLDKTDKKLKKQYKKKFSIYALLGKIGDVLLIPIMIVALISSISMLASRSQNKPTSVMGRSLVTVLTTSMTKGGFERYDTVLTEKVKGKNVEVGDILAFYDYNGGKVNKTKLERVEYYIKCSGVGTPEHSEENIETLIDREKIKTKEVAFEKTVKNAQEAKSRVLFHRVIAVYVDENGIYYFQTKGDSNATTDGDNLIRQDFIVGRYVNTPRAVRDIIKFCASTFGMIVLVCIPLSLQVLLQCLSLIEQLGIINNEKALLKGKASFKDDEFRKDFDGNLMELYNKVYYLYLMPKEDRHFVKQCMWGNLIYAEKLSSKNQIILDAVNVSEKNLEESDDKYWNTWIDSTKGYDRRKIQKLYEKLATENIFKQTKTVSEIKETPKQKPIQKPTIKK